MHFSMNASKTWSASMNCSISVELLYYWELSACLLSGLSLTCLNNEAELTTPSMIMRWTLCGYKLA